jgi:membrane-bound inhibitor of C-type lysozyme
LRTVIMLAAAASALAACQRENAGVVDYQCGELAVSAVFRGEDRAMLAIGDRKLDLALVPAASGAKYADGQGNEFWTRGPDEAMLTLAGEATRSCRAAGG